MANIIKTFRPAYCGDHKPSRLVCVWCLLISGLFYLAAVTNTASAATYYLDAVNGDDSNDGSSDNPWKTFTRALVEASDGDTFYMRDGNYGDFINATERSNWVKFIAEPGQNAVNVNHIRMYHSANVYLWFEGLNITGWDASGRGIFSYGISHVRVIDCNFSSGPTCAGYNDSSGMAIKIHDASDWYIENCDINDWYTGVRGDNADDITITGCEISLCVRGISASGNNWLIDDVDIHDTTDGIRVHCANSVIQDCWIHDLYPVPDGPVGDHTDAIQGFRNGPYLENITIRRCIIGPPKNYSESGQGIYFGMGTEECNNLTIENNMIYDSAASDLYLLGAVINTTIRNNIVNGNVYISEGSAGYIPSVTEMTGNMFWRLTVDLDGGVPVDDHDYNIVYQWWGAWSGGPMVGWVPGAHSIEYQNQDMWEAQFADYDANDFHLAADSLAIDFCSLDKAPSTDLNGNSRVDISGVGNDGTDYADAGCYEYVSSDPNNPTPELQAIGDKLVDENVALIFDVNATDPNGEPITYSAQSLPSGATLDSLTGEFDWTPSYNQAGSYQVTFRASDGNSWDSETITITVNNVNRPPVIGAITDQSVNENDILSLSVEASDPDGQALTYSVSGLPAGAVFVSQTLTWTPSYDQAGTFPVTFTADDGQAQDSQPITITVINVNRTPVLAAINNQSVWADDPLTFTIDATDPDGDAVTYSVGTLPSGATFTSQDFDWTPSQGQMGSYDVTFIASDGQLQDSQTVTITVDVDSLAPTITNLSPTAGSIQVPLNNLITLNVTDAGKGVNANSVKIKVKINSNPNNDTVYFGDMDHYISLLGDCRRIGSNADYKFVFQPTQDLFYYDQTVTITVNATDLAGNIMDEYSYSFATEMHSFGQNKQVNSGSGNNDRPVTVCDSSGNIWTAWHAGPIGNRDIYIGKLATGADDFGSTVQLTDDATDQCKPAVALDSSDKLYVVWQDNREGDWDIYISTSVDGISWSTEIRVNDPNNGNQVNPAIVIDGQSPNQAHVVWQDDRAGNQDICIATSSDGFATKTVSQITTDSFDQVEPAVAADADNTIYVVWTDGRNGSNDIYGAASNNPWTNVAIVSNANNQSSPTIAAESVGAILHLLWVDDTLGDKDIYYASSDGLPGSPLTGSSIIDDSSGADQLEPAIAVTGSTGNNLKVFACWQDWRNTDTDLYFAELSSSSGTNVFVGDGGSSTYQGEPVIGIDEYSHPYLIWADNRSTNTEIYYAGSTFVEPVALASELVAASAPSSTTVGADPQAITTIDDVSIVVPVGACSFDVAITVTKIANPQTFAAPCLGGYDFGPSGIQFSQPVTITIPYVFAGSDISATPYWFNALSGNLSQQGITNVQDIVISPTLHALSFKTTHFTAFYLLGGGAAAVLGGGGGGGCSVSAGSEGNIVEFILPYIGLAVVMVILKMRDARYRKARST